MNHFKKFRDEYAFGSVKRLVEGSKSYLDDEFGVSESDLSEAELGVLSELSWGDLERGDGRSEWVTFSYDDSIIRVYVYAAYEPNDDELKYTNVRFGFQESGVACPFRVSSDGRIKEE